MIKTLATLALCCGAFCAAQSPAPPFHSETASAPTRHFRLNFVLTYPDSVAGSRNQHASQTLSVDVPVQSNHPSAATIATLAGEDGRPETTLQQTLKCTDVHLTSTGLAAQVTLVADSVTRPTPASLSEPIHHALTFTRKVDVALKTPTTITNEMKLTSLKPGDEKLGVHPPPAPQITLTVTEL